jgi:preprotein translocase YajC subunit
MRLAAIREQYVTIEISKYGVQALMILGVAGAFYIALIKPQLDRIYSNQAFLQNLKVGDTVVTDGGIIGKIMRFETSDVVILALNDALQIRIMRSGINGYFSADGAALEAKTSTVATASSRATTA